MKRQFFLMIVNILFVGILSLQNVQAAGKPLQADYLRSEYRVDPQGIDVANPRLSWILKSEQRGQKQTAYHVLVASSLKALQQNQHQLYPRP